MAALSEDKTIRLMFSCYKCISKVKLNIKSQMAFLVKKINMDITDGKAMLAAFY